MKKYLLSILLIVCCIVSNAISKNIYVAPSGSDSNPGTEASPLGTIQRAVDLSVAGDFIYLRGGTYNISATIRIAPANNGTAASPIRLWAYGTEKPYLNYSTQPYASNQRGILLTASYWHIKGLEIGYAGDNGIKVEGNNNTIELCVLHHCGDTGIQLGFAHETVNPNGALCAYNKIINCDAYLNFDFDSKGGDADGFACKMHNGKGNVFKGCRAWDNSDDGWDLYETDWPVEILDCWTWHNGDQTLFDAIYFAKMGTKMSSYSGNGNGFKLGGNGTGGSSEGTHIVKNCVSFDNNFRSKKGFDQNSHKGGVILHNNTSFGNGYNYMFEDNANSGSVNEFKNNVSFAPKGSLAFEFSSGSIQQNNSWNLPVTADINDFVDLSVAAAKAPRQADGSLPTGFARLVSGSDLIDKGVNVGLPFKGAAPDLGAFEFGGTSPVTYTLTTSVVGQGSVTPSGGSFASGASLSLQATPAAGWKFDGWSGAVTGATNPVSLVMNSNKSVTATFSQINTTKFTLTTSTLGSGSVSLNPAGGSYDPNTNVTITATPAAGWKFDGWSGAVAGATNPVSLVMNSNKSITATFSQINTTKFTLTTTALGSGSISLNPAGGSYDLNTVVTATATPASGWKFDGWSGAATGTTNPVSITMNANKTLSAAFSQVNTSCTWVQYQLENGTWNTGTIIETKNAGFTGASYVNTNNATASWFQISVSVPSAGNHNLKLRYANVGPADRPVSISVNGASVISNLSLPSTTSWTTWAQKDLSVSLNAGNNTIRFTALTSNGAPNADRLDVCQNGSQTLRTEEIEAIAAESIPVGWASVNHLGQNGTTGGQGGPVIDIYDFATFQKEAKSIGKKVLIIHGKINASGSTSQINVMSDKSIIGADNGAYINFGLKLRGNNVIIRNMDIWNGGQGDAEGHDGVGFGSNNHHIWVDHCTIHECLDGALDPTYNCRFITVSYCRFYKQNKTMLICGNDGDSKAIAAQKNADKKEWHYTVTVHHCWFDKTDQRHPRVRNGAVHAFNNYIDNTGTYAIGRGDNANIYSEANYFNNTKDAFATYDDKNHPGFVEDVNSLFEGNNGVAKDNPPTGAWVWKPIQYYPYTAHSAEWVKANLKNVAGVGKMNVSARTLSDASEAAPASSIAESKADIELFQNYPNPVSTSTTIGLWLKEESQVKINLYNAFGGEVAEIANKKFDAGYNEVKYENRGLKSGVYIYLVRTGKSSLKRQMIVK